ncbi:hypothetical protein Arub01_17140 [Actinomadura rubrobrunea]|uniref:Uncharacterized protein n=1 Tax=Actinomadura rubrobrunea TaxID=115335 RepID=A0A9W6UWA4_9ACTN|nr:DUF5701 family protein [Actinomadura rubrobrunea]GLW63470.1 hypothetical protein Arub01_17140 [Actinomadura rubrobrunea]
MSGFDADAEFDRQVRTLLERGHPAAAGMTPEEFGALLEPLRAAVTARAAAMAPPEEGRVPFVLVVTREVVPPERAVALTTLAGRGAPGVVDRNFADGDLARFVPTGEAAPPDARAYALFDVDRGEEFRGAVPEDALAAIAGRGRTPLTIEEGIALITQYPAVLAKNKCFSLGGSRCGDRRVPALWISRNAPKLGWCWAGNPHTWLGMASAAARAAAPR